MLSYKDTVLADNPILFWRFEEAGPYVNPQSIADSSPNNMTGTLYNATSAATTSSIVWNELYTGTPSASIFANSTSPSLYVDPRTKFTGSFDISPANPIFSVEFWYKPVAFSNFNNNVGQDQWGYFLFVNDVNGGGYCGMQLADRFATADIGQFRAGATYHIVFTYDGTIGRLYRNGFKIAEKPMAPPSQWSSIPANNSWHSYWGINSTPSQAWNASFDNLAIYKTQLSDAQVKNHYQVGISGTQVYGQYETVIQLANPTVYYRLGDASGSSPNIKDHSQTNGFPGTIVGGASGLQFQQASLVDGRDTDGGLSGTTPGNSPYILTPASTGLGAGQFTVEWWLKPSANPTGSDINNTIGPGFTKFFAGMCSGSGEGFCGINTKDMFTSRDLQQGFFKVGQGAMYAFAYDGNYGYIGKNGRWVAWKKMQPSVAWGANGFAIGSGSIQGEYDEVAIYNNAIFYDELWAHYVYGLGTASLPAPSISGALAFSGSVYGAGNQILSSGGSYVVLSGSNFQPNTRVYVSGVQCQPFQGLPDQYPSPNLIVSDNSGKRQFVSSIYPSSSGSQLAFWAPTGTVGAAPVTILNPDGQSATGTVVFVTASDDYHARAIADQPYMFWRLDDPTGSYHLPPYVATDANDVIYWRLQEASPPYLSTGNGSSIPLNPPTGVTAVTSSAGFAPYPGSGSVAFPGPEISPYYLDTGPTGTNISEVANLTAGCWVYVLDYGFNWAGGFGNFASILGKAYRPDSSVWAAPFWTWNLQFLNDATGRLFAQISVGGTSHGLETNFVVPLRQWCHIGLTYDGTTMTLYGNGASVGTLSIGGAIDYSVHGPYRIGGGNPLNPVNAQPADNFHGYVSDVRIANIVRNAAYFSQFSGSGGPSTVADWSNHGYTGSVFLGLPNLLWQQPGLIRGPGPGQPANRAMTNIAGDAPTPFVANTGDSTGLSAPPAAGIGSGSAANAITSFTAMWWARRDQIPLWIPSAVNFPLYRFGFANNQFLYNVSRADGQVTVGTDSLNSMVINNFVEPNITYPTRAHHYAFSYFDNGNQGTGVGAIYRDGVLIQSNSSQRVPQGWQAFEAIGPFSGTFDEVIVYPYAMTGQQIANHYSTGALPGTIGDTQWSFMGATGAFPAAGGVNEFMWPNQSFPLFKYSGSIASLPKPGFIGDFSFPFFTPLAEGAPGFFNAEQLFDLTPPFQLQAIQGAGFLNSHQNVEYLWNIGSGSGGGGGGGGPPTPPAPVIQNFNPGVGVAITSGTILSFDVVDANGVAPVYAAILANFVGNPIQELVYNSVAFNAQYSNNKNTITPISGGFHFTLLRDGGWPSSVTLTPIAFSSGSENT